MIALRQITDIFSLLTVLRGKKSGYAINVKPGSPRSIKSISSQAILQFPLLVSSNISPDNVIKVARGLEAEYATFVKLSMELEDDVIGSRSTADKVDYIKRFHTNIKTGSMLVNEALNMLNEEGISSNVELAGLSKNAKLNEQNIRLLTPISEDLENAILNDKYNIEKVKILSEAKGGSGNTDRKSRKSIDVHVQDKKVNQTAPLMLSLTLNYKAESGTVSTTNLNIGVKAIVHTVDSSEFNYFLPSAIRDNNFVFRAIQFTTGEIRFVRDFLLNINKIKRQANADKGVKKVTKWWHTLTRMSKLNKIMSYFNKHKFLPSATMVLSMNDVENIKTNEGIDVMSADSVNRLYKIYFLLGFVVVDETSEMVYNWNEETNSFQTIPFAQYKKESDAAASGSLKLLQNLISMR